jgi:predicted alpha/beta-hydrolase family hydrolase
MSAPYGVATDRWDPPGEPVGTAVVLPGRAYPPAAPLLAFAGYALLAAGWSVRDVWWEEPVQQDATWVGARLATATDGVDGPVMVVGKSLGTRATALAAERSYPAIWLTPLLTDPACVDGIRANPARQLLIGGTADDLWDPAAAASLASERVDVLQLDGLDHVLLDRADPVRSAEALVEVTRAMVRFLRS